MKWKTKRLSINTEWKQIYIWKWPVKTEDGFTVIFETVWVKYKIHMDGGKYIYNYQMP